MFLMIGYSNRSYLNFVFALVDGFFILLAIFIGNILRFGGRTAEIFYAEYFFVKILAAMTVIQIAYYYFDLYEFKSMRDRTKMGILLLEALGVGSIFLAVVYFVFPVFALWRGALVNSLIVIFVLTFCWRIVYSWAISRNLFKERILIIGTGEVASKVKKEIEENGQGEFEIVGFVDENRERIGERIPADDHRGFQPDLFHLQRR
jgi:FlaA1/EpsC-like NDP-sugar epimerase